MVELCGARPVAARSTSAAPARQPRSSGCARRAWRRCSARAIPRDEQARSSSGSASASPRPTTASTSTSRTGVATTSPARPTSSRRSGASGATRSCRSRCRHGAASAAGSSPAQRLRRRAEDALVGAGISEILGWSFAAPTLVERLRSRRTTRAARRRLANPMSEDQSVLRTSLLGPLLDNVARNRARGTRTCGCGSTARSTSPRAATAPATERGQRDHVPGLDRLPTEEQHLGALLTGRLRPPTWRDPEPARADFFAAKGVLGALMDGAPRPVGGRARARAVPASRPPARVLAGGEPAGWLGELHPAWRRAGTSSRRRASSSTSACSRGTPTWRPTTRT